MGELNESGVEGDSDCGLMELDDEGDPPGIERWRRR